jgi:DNA repair protein RadC
MVIPTEREIREKLIVSGAGTLSDAELVAVIIGEGTNMLSPVRLAENIIADFGGSLSELALADIPRLRRAAGSGTRRAVALAAAAELARRITAEEALSIETVTSKDDVARIFAPLSDLKHEEFWVLYLTSGGKVIDRAKVSQGGVSGTVVDYRLIVKRAIELLATSIILVHNHPSGIAQPSQDDISITETVASAAALFDINVIDHIIISREGSFSFAEQGLMNKR